MVLIDGSCHLLAPECFLLGGEAAEVGLKQLESGCQEAGWEESGWEGLGNPG